jgi:hypothetical protein
MHDTLLLSQARWGVRRGQLIARGRRLATRLWLVLVASLAAAPAYAGPGNRVGLVPFKGSGAEKLQRAAAKALTSHGFRVVEIDDVRATRAGATLDEATLVLAAQSDLVGVMGGVVTTKGRNVAVTLSLRAGKDGSVVGERTWSSRKGAGALARVVQSATWSAFGAELKRLRDDPAAARPETPVKEAPPAAPEPPAPPKPEPPAPAVSAVPTRTSAPVVVQSRAVDEPAPATGATHPHQAAVELVVGPRMSTRELSYTGATVSEFHTNRPYTALGFGAAWFPLLGRPQVGLAIEGQFGARAHATRAETLTYELRTNEVTGSALVGYPFEWVTVDLVAGGGIHETNVIGLDAAASMPSPIPDVSYKYLRGGLGLHVYTPSPFALFAGGYYRHVLSAGGIAGSDWFPHLQVRGMDVTAGASYRILSWLEARLQVDGRIYDFKMKADPGAARFADSAVDRYWGAWLGAAALFGGAKPERAD